MCGTQYNKTTNNLIITNKFCKLYIVYPSFLKRKLCLQMHNITYIFAHHDRENNLIIKQTGTTTVAQFVERSPRMRKIGFDPRSQETFRSRLNR